MSIKSELLAIQEENDGLLRAADVVEWAAEHDESALHRSLEWDNDTAGHAYRLWQVRGMIALHIVMEDTGQRQAISLTIDRVNAGGGYRAIEDILRTPNLREVMLADALAELNRVRSKYEAVVELVNVWSELDKVSRKKIRRHAKGRRKGKAEIRAGI